MKAFGFYFLILIFTGCSNIEKLEKISIYNPQNGETIYLKYCLYNSGHEATMISLDSISKNPDDIVNEYIAEYDNSIYFYRLKEDTLTIYCYGYNTFQTPKNKKQYKTTIKIIDNGVSEWDILKKEYKRMGLRVFPLCNMDCKIAH